MTSTADVDRLKCEKIVNEIWSDVNTHFDELDRILKRGFIRDEGDEAILMIAAHAALAKITMDQADEKVLFE